MISECFFATVIVLPSQESIGFLWSNANAVPANDAQAASPIGAP